MFYAVYLHLCLLRQELPSTAAAALEISKSSLYAWKNYSYMPQIRTLQKMAGYFNVTLTDIYKAAHAVKFLEGKEAAVVLHKLMPLPPIESTQEEDT